MGQPVIATRVGYATPQEAIAMGTRAREHVRQHFLITNNLLAYCRQFNKLLGQRG